MKRVPSRNEVNEKIQKISSKQKELDILLAAVAKLKEEMEQE